MDPLDIVSLRTRWLCALGVREEAVLDRRLRWDGIDPSALLMALANLDAESPPNSDLATNSEPDLLADLCRAIATSEAVGHATPPWPFADIWQPAVGMAETRLRQRSAVAIESSAMTGLSAALLRRLCDVGSGALWAMFQAERGVGASLVSALMPDLTAADLIETEVYARFVSRHRCDGLATVLARFPLLASFVTQVVTQWLATTTEMLSRINRDLEVLDRTFGIPTKARLVDISLGLGDPHCCGRSVALLRFFDGQDHFKLLYKPRDLGLDFEFQRLLSDPVVLGGLPPLASVRVLPCVGYGYMEHVEHAPCKGVGELRRFYENSGRISALLHALGYTDGHFENFIARGPNLFFIDGETLFTPVIAPDLRAPRRADLLAEGRAIWEAFDDSIARTEMFPLWQASSPDPQPVDTSCFGATSQTDIQTQPGWVAVNTDHMHRGLVPVPPRVISSSPVRPGQPSAFTRYQQEFRRGFEAQCVAIIRSRDVWLSSGGILDRFRSCTRRAVLRATRVYAALRQQQVSSEALRSMANRQLVLEKMGRLFLTRDACPRHWAVFADERRQLARLDIPYFSHAVESCALTLDNGQNISSFFEASGLDRSRAYIRSLGPAQIAAELAIVTGMTMAGEQRIHTFDALEPLAHASSFLTPEARLRAACTIAERLERREHGGGWLGFDLAQDGDRFHFQPLGLSLYSGTMGIAVFFGTLAAADASRAGRCHAMVRRILEPLRAFCDATPRSGFDRWWRDQPIGLAGAGGQLLGLIALSELPGGPHEAHEIALRLVEGVEPENVVCRGHDVLSGAAGAIGPLLRLGSPPALRLAEALGERLLSWASSEAVQTCDLGFARGLAGPLAALAALQVRFGDAHYTAAVCNVQEASRLQIASAVGTSEKSNTMMGTSWYQGLAGQALGRMCLLDTPWYNDSEEARLRADLARLQSRSPGGTSLCCGNLGAAAVLQMADHLLGETTLGAASAAMVATAFASWRDALQATDSAAPPLAAHLGYLNGWSGLGMTLLADPVSRAANTLLLTAGLVPQKELWQIGDSPT